MKNLMHKAPVLLIAILFMFSESAFAQRGVGDPVGVARQGAEIQPATITGTLKEIQTGPCDNTTGRSMVGTHLIIETETGEEVNVHLGFARAVAQVTDQLKPGQDVNIEAFRTENLPENAYVAKSVSSNGRSFTLRDDSLRPMWAGGAGNWQWSNARSGRGTGRRGQAAGQGGRGRCWAW